MASVKIKTEGLDGISLKVDLAASKAKHAVAVQAKKDTEPYTPAMTLSLSNRTRVEDGHIIYPGPYARYLYHGKLVVDPETGSAWARKGTSKVKTDKNLVFNRSVHSKAQSQWFEASKAQNKEKWVRVAQKAVKNEL